jgi:hypothetical protein
MKVYKIQKSKNPMEIQIRSFAHYLELKRKYNEITDALHYELTDTVKFPIGSQMGLPTKETFNNPEYRKLKAEFKYNFSILRALNGYASKVYKKELRDAYSKKMAAYQK